MHPSHVQCKRHGSNVKDMGWMFKYMSIHQNDSKKTLKSNFITSCLAFRGSIQQHFSHHQNKNSQNSIQKPILNISKLQFQRHNVLVYKTKRTKEIMKISENKPKIYIALSKIEVDFTHSNAFFRCFLGLDSLLSKLI